MTSDTDLSRQEKIELLKLLEEKDRRIKENYIDTLFPEDGKFGRPAYKKHIAFFAAGKDFSQRALIAANQVGKSLAVAYELTCHLTGEYPDWWEGKKYTHAIQSWAAGFKSNLRETIQEYLIGDINNPGAGLIRKSIIKRGRITRKAGLSDVAQDIYVPHKSGGLSRVTLKSYEEEAKAFQGARLDFVWLDEEPPKYKLYSECATRLVAKNGIMACSFTPVNQLSEVVLSFLDEGKYPENGVGESRGRFVATVGWPDVPHLSEARKKELISTYLPHEIEARTTGIVGAGVGAVYPLTEDNFKVDPFDIPITWPRAYGLDVGWNKTAAIFGAYDKENDTWYIYSEHYMGRERPVVHAEAIKARGSWIYGVIDPASKGRSQKDGTRLLDEYVALGLNLAIADNAVEAGLLHVLQRLISGRLKVFTTCSNWFGEYRIYRRDEHGKIVKKSDHAMDATRYLMMSGLNVATTMPDMDDDDEFDVPRDCNDITGY